MSSSEDLPRYTAREIAQMLPDEWKLRLTGDAYLHPQNRLTMRLETNHSFQVMAYEERDPKQSSQAMVEDMLKVFGDHLTPQDMMNFVLRFAEHLTDWQVASRREDDWVGDELRAILARHVAAKAGK